MIPLRLKLHNFKSFKDDEIIFEGLGAVAICGENGAGKSSIIDSMIWALWGKSEIALADGIIRQNETTAEVEFDFEVNNEQYRVIRKRTRAKSTNLSLFKISNSNNISLTESTIAATEKRIDSLLNMNYDTFINSAYIRQGHSDEFNTKTPSQQKSILGKILSIGFYENCEQLAKDKNKEVQSSIAILERDIGNSENDILNLDQLKEDKSSKTDYIHTKEQEQQKLASQLDVLKGELGVLKGNEERFKLLSREIDSLQNNIQAIERRIANHDATITKLTEIVSRREEIDTNYQAYQESKAIFDFQQDARDKAIKLRDKKKDLTVSIEQEKNKLEIKEEHLNQKLIELRTKIATKPQLEKELEEIQKKIEETDKKNVFIDKKQLAIEKNKQKQAENSQAILNFNNTIDSNNEKLKMLSHSHTDAHCPLCNSELQEKELNLVIQKLNDEINECNNQIEVLNKQQGEIEKQIETDNKEIALFQEKNKKEQLALQTEFANKTVLIQEANKAIEEEKGIANEYQTIHETLENNTYASNALAQIEQIRKEFNALGYDEEKLKASKATCLELDEYEKLKIQLDEAIPNLDKASSEKLSEEQLLNNQKQSLQSSQDERASIIYDEVKVQEKESEISKVTASKNVIDLEVKTLSTEIGVLTEKIRQLEEQKDNLSNLNKQLVAAREDESIYKQLTEIFSAKGIRALLIEDALPFLNNEANALIEKMSDGEMSLQFNTQKQLTNGKQEETLEVSIFSNGGDRGYSSYSGGERFRIDLAIRIAMSRLLTSRVGAPMQTLIIDEGFGTQDENGIDRVISAINAIRDEFKMIIVITHIDALKNAFDNKIVVTKNDGISNAVVC